MPSPAGARSSSYPSRLSFKCPPFVATPGLSATASAVDPLKSSPSPLACAHKRRRSLTTDLDDFEPKMSRLAFQLKATESLMQLCLGEQYNERTRSLRNPPVLTAYD
ncbi:hypothetical protein BST61_g5504 [Cercospora zeina]